MIEEVAISKIADLVFEKYRKLQEEKKEKITKVQFVADRFSHTELDSAAITAEEFDRDNPSLSFENPYKKPCRVKQVSLAPDANFGRKGMVEIFIGDEMFFASKKFGNFANVSDLKIPLYGGEMLKPDESVNILIKSEDGTDVGLAVCVTFGD